MRELGSSPSRVFGCRLPTADTWTSEGQAGEQVALSLGVERQDITSEVTVRNDLPPTVPHEQEDHL